MGFERFEHSSTGYQKIMKSAGVQGILLSKAQRVAAAVGTDIDFLSDWEMVTDVRSGRNRGRAMVSGVPLQIEQSRGILARAIDAARG
ncbi:MAG: hypothetical protein GY925_10400 [Actinomycetia bacterium]|nr:hypothetical protein [Actinomycetes bacterium]